MIKMDNYTEELIKKAIQSRKFSYSPYSKFMVGASVLTKNGNIYTGCNIENVAFSPTICAERTAIFKAISSGEQEFLAIAITGANRDVPINKSEYCTPCGVCRQVMSEFCDSESFRVILCKSEHEWIEYTLKDMLPLSFNAKLE